jgi:hypothetical protein
VKAVRQKMSASSTVRPIPYVKLEGAINISVPSRIIRIEGGHNAADVSRAGGFYEDFACTGDNA